ncbi:MAG: hypothetical protein LC746_16985 [Acidobacteria bacterium]|nr:hypothetical protein [Acidobacteriota bacterium]
MKHTRRLARLLAPLLLLFALAQMVAPAQNANDQGDRQSQEMIRQTRRCIRDARRDYNRCRRRADGRRGALTRCRRRYDEQRNGCSG